LLLCVKMGLLLLLCGPFPLMVNCRLIAISVHTSANNLLHGISVELIRRITSSGGSGVVSCNLLLLLVELAMKKRRVGLSGRRVRIERRRRKID